MWSRITRYNLALRADSTKCSRPRLDCFFPWGDPSGTMAGSKAVCFLSKNTPHSGVFFDTIVPPAGIEPTSRA